MKIHYLQHVPYEDPGFMLPWFETQGYTVTGTHLYKGQPCPPASEYDVLVIMGGPMNIYEEQDYPWLKEEKRCIREAIGAGKKILGICLGAQLIADVLGARVYRNEHREIGWFPVNVMPDAKKLDLLRTFPDQFEAFHWHGDTFELPEGAVHLFRSEACRNQGFLYKNNVLALQFHLETTPEGARTLIRYGRKEMDRSRYVQSAEEIMASVGRYQSLNKLANSLVDSWINN